MIENCPHFVYVLVDPLTPGDLRYVGQTGSLPQRWTTHLQLLKREPTNPLYVWWAELVTLGREPLMRLLWQGPKTAADAKETQAIREYRRLGFALLNQNEGGPGNRGWVPSADTRVRMSAASKGKPKSDETRARMSAGMSGKPKSAAHCAALSAAKKGRPTPHLHTPEAIAKKSASWTPERRAANAERLRARHAARRAKEVL